MNADLRGLLNEIAGDCRVAYGVTEESYRAYCRNGAMGTFPADTWAVHCQRRLGQIEQALASLSVAQGQGWLPIESAPRDGTVVDLWSRLSGHRVANVQWLHGSKRDPERCGPGGVWEHLAAEGWAPVNSKEGCGSFTEEQFTHWMPLPAAPAQPDGVSK